jgi:hypothetical protein
MYVILYDVKGRALWRWNLELKCNSNISEQLYKDSGHYMYHLFLHQKKMPYPKDEFMCYTY